LTATQEASQAVPVEIVYMERRPVFQGMGSVHLEGPRLDVPSTIANWAIYTPREVKFLRMSGNVERGAAAFAFLDEPFMPSAAAAEPKGAFFEQLRSEASLSRKSHMQEMRDEDGFQAQFGGARLMAPAASSEDRLDGPDLAWIGRANETGILPLKIQLPKSGTVYRFNRLMTTGDPLKLDGTFVHLRWSWVLFAAIGLLVVPLAGLVVARLGRRQ